MQKEASTLTERGEILGDRERERQVERVKERERDIDRESEI